MRGAVQAQDCISLRKGGVGAPPSWDVRPLQPWEEASGSRPQLEGLSAQRGV